MSQRAVDRRDRMPPTASENVKILFTVPAACFLSAAYTGEVAMLKTLKTFTKDESGATAIEYGLIAALVAVGLIGALTALGNSLSSIFMHVSTTLNSASA